MNFRIKLITFFLFFIFHNSYSQVAFTIKQVGLGKDSLHQIIVGNFMEVVPKKVNDSILEYVFFPTKPEYLFVVNDIPTRWETRVWIDNKMGNKGLIIDYKNRTTNIINENEWDIVTKKVLEFKDSKRYTESDSLIKRYIDKNSNSYLSLWLLGFMHNKSNQLVMLDKLSGELKEYPEYRHLKANLLDRKYPNIGDTFKEFTLKDRNDLVFNSNIIKNKFILLHFWSKISNSYIWLRLLPFIFFIGSIISIIYLFKKWNQNFKDYALLFIGKAKKICYESPDKRWEVIFSVNPFETETSISFEFWLT